MKKNVILPTQAQDSQPLPRVVPRAAPSGQPSVKADYPSLGLEVYTKLIILPDHISKFGDCFADIVCAFHYSIYSTRSLGQLMNVLLIAPVEGWEAFMAPSTLQAQLRGPMTLSGTSNMPLAGVI